MKRIKLALATPYVGLRPFTEAEALLFFGRDAHVQELLARLQRRQRFLAVLGASGSGKSSLVRAGLIPALHRGALQPMVAPGDRSGAGDDVARWNVCIFTPGNTPLANLAQALTGDPRWADGTDPVDARDALTAALGNGPLSLANLYRRKAGQFTGEALLLVVDQFEEIFRYRQRNPDEADRFVKLLLRSATEPLPIYVVMTMRSDFLGQAVAVQGLAEAINSGIYLTPRLDIDSIRSVITAPLALVGGSIDPVLTTRLLNTLGSDDELPVLQHALLRMWDRVRSAGRTAIETEDFVAVCAPRDGQGRSAGEPALPHAIDNHASEIFDALTPQQQAAARPCFLALAERRDGRDVRRPQTLRELQALVPAEWQDALVAVVQAYRAAGVGFLLPAATRPLGPDDQIDISHESLIRRWRRFQAWLAEEALDVSELREWQQRARRHADGGGWLDGNDGRRAQDWRARVAGRAIPAQWAARYGDAAGYDMVDAYIQGSLAQLQRQQAAEEALRREAEEARVMRHQLEMQMQREATARAEADKDRAEREKAQAETVAAQDRRRSRIAMAGGLVSLLLAGFAAFFWWQAQQARQWAQAGELAVIAETEGRRNPDLGVLLALQAHRIAPVPRVLGLLRAAQSNYTYRLVLRGHGDRVTSAQFSADGKTVLTTSVDKTARLWDAASGRELYSLKTTHTLTVIGARWSPDADGSQILTWSEDGTVQLFDAGSGRQLRVLPGTRLGLESAQFTSDGKLVLITGVDGSVRLWDPATGATQGAGLGEAPANGPPWVAQGKAVHVGGEQGAQLWDLAQPGRWYPLRVQAERVVVARLSADGRRAVSVGDDGTTGVWDLAEGGAPRLQQQLKTGGRIVNAWLSLDGRSVVTGGEDAQLHLWDAATGRQQHVLRGHEGRLANARFSTDGRRLVTAGQDGTARVWDVATGSELRNLRGHSAIVSDAALSPDGKTVVTASRDGTARLWEATDHDEPRVLQRQDGPVHAVALSPDGSRLLTAGEDRTARLWEAASSAPLQVLRGHEGPVRSAQWSTDGRAVLTAADDATARLWEAASGRETRALRGHAGAVLAAAFSPAGTQVVTAGNDKTVRLWDLDGSAEPRLLQGHQGPVFSVQFSPDGRTVVSASDDKEARLQDLKDGQPPRVLKGHRGPVLSARFSADGKTVVTASGDESARLWDVTTAQELRALRGHKGAVRSAALSADGRTVLTGGDDGTLRLWDAGSGIELRVLRGHAKSVLSVGFTADGKSLVSAGDDGTVRLWPCDICLAGEEAVAAIAARVGRQLDDDERRRFGLHAKSR